MAQVGLFKKVGKYTDKRTGKEKSFTNFYVRCGDSLIPVQVVYYENDEGRDPHYAGRKQVLKAFAEKLPDKNEPEAPKRYVVDLDGKDPF